MDYELDPTSAQAAYGACRILRSMWAPTSPLEPYSRCFDFAGAALHSAMFPAAGLVPEVTTYRNAQCAIIAVGGITGVNNPVALANSYMNDSPSSETLSCNPRVYAAAQELLARCVPAGYMDRPYVWLIGHSYGGAIVQAFAAMYAGRTIDFPIRLCTFGSPRMGTSLFYDRVKACSRGRWVTRNDPVPHAPFQPSEAPTLYGFLSDRQRQRMGNYVNYMQSFQVHAGGQIYAVASSELGTPVTESNFYSWMIGARGLSANAHKIAFYESSLMLANVIPSPNPPTLPAVPDTQERPERITPIVRATINAAVNGVADESGINRGVPVNIPPASRATYRRAGSMYQIVWQGAVVAVAPNIRQARSMCRHMNASNRTLLTMVRSESSAYVAALGAFLKDAAAGTDGFAPKLADGGNVPVDPFA